MNAIAVTLVLALTLSTIPTTRLAAFPAAAGDQKTNGPGSNWSRVQAVMPGSRLTVARNAGEPQTDLYFIEASDPLLVVAGVAKLSLPKHVKQTLLASANARPDLWRKVLDGSDVFLTDRLRLSENGLFDRGRKLADLDQLIQQIRRDDIESIGLVRQKASLKATIGGGAGAFLGGLGLNLILGLSEFRCGTSCGQLTALLLIGPTLAGTAAGYHADRHEMTTLIYQRPAPN